jgi:putative transposase
MLRVTLSREDREVARALRHERTLRPAERDRVEMVLLSAAGWSPPRIAAHFGCHPATVRGLLKRVGAVGLDAVRRRRPGPPKDAAKRARVAAALDRLLGQDRTWTAPQLAAALADEGIALSARQTRRHLKRMGARWRRTVSTLAPKQDPMRVAQARRVLTSLKKSPPPARSASPIWTSAASAPASRPR